MYYCTGDSLDCDWIYSLWCFVADLWPFHLTSDVHPQLCSHMCTWWLSDEKVFCFHSQVWHIEEWKDAGGVLVGKDSDIRTRALSLWVSLSLSLHQICTHMHTTLGQQHRWVLGKQAAAGGGKDHKAGRLAKFHHLLWIAWDAHSAAARGMSHIHMIHMQPPV